MDHKLRVYNDVFELLPSEENPSPLVRINRMNPCPEFQLFAKLEWMNPFGSVKDRAAWQMLRDLEDRGELGNVAVSWSQLQATPASASRRWRGRAATTCGRWCRTKCRWKKRYY